MDIDKIYWHKAVLPALQLELEPYLQFLSFEAEHQLASDRLSIDVVIKKNSNVLINNSIARIFRTYNIFEYKSPTVSLSYNEFYKGLTYITLYGSIHKVDIVDMSLSIIVTQKPEEVLRYIQYRLNYEVTEREQGIYTVRGFPFALQIIENKKLSPKENAFLPLLNTDLDREAVKFILTEAQKGHSMNISAFVDVILQANPHYLEEIFMENKTLEQVLKDVGLAARWEAQGEEIGKEIKAKEIAQNLIKIGLPREQIIATTGLDFSTVESLIGAAHA